MAQGWSRPSWFTGQRSRSGAPASPEAEREGLARRNRRTQSQPRRHRRHAHPDRRHPPPTGHHDPTRHAHIRRPHHRATLTCKPDILRHGADTSTPVPRPIAAMHEIDRAGTPITFEAVGVSRSWLYSQTDLKDEFRRPRRPTPAPAENHNPGPAARERQVPAPTPRHRTA